MTTVLGSWTEPAERTPEHDALRANVPARVSVRDYWDVSAMGTEDVNGDPTGIRVIRRARVSNLSPRALGIKDT